MCIYYLYSGMAAKSECCKLMAAQNSPGHCSVSMTTSVSSFFRVLKNESFTDVLLDMVLEDVTEL